MTAVRQIGALGYRAADVRHIVLSHSDFDHAGNLDDFPDATAHMLAAARTTTKAQATLLDRMRYRRQQVDAKEWAHLRHRGRRPWIRFRGRAGVGRRRPDIVMMPITERTLDLADIAPRQGTHWLF